MSDETRRAARRERRKAERAAAAAQAAKQEAIPDEADKAAAQAETAGSGDPPSAATISAARQDNALVARAIKNRWPVTDEHRSNAIRICVRNMECEDGLVSNGALRNLIAIEGQNQRDELHQANLDKAAASTNVQVNVGMMYGANGAPIPSVEEIRAKLAAAEKILQAHAGGSK